MQSSTGRLGRRSLLEILALGAGVVALGRATSQVRVARAEATSPRFLVHAYFDGGWDQLLALDPRDNTEPRYSRAQAYATGGSGIHPAYDLVEDAETKDLLAANPSGVQRRGALSFGPAVPASLLAHAADLSICRGVRMDTLTHEVGRRYFFTGKFPRGLQANGSSITSVAASQGGAQKLLANLAIATEAYADGLPAFASPLRVGSGGDLLALLQPLGAPISATSAEAMRAFEEALPGCSEHALDASGAATLLRDSRARVRAISSSGASALFKFNATAPTPETRALFDAMGIATAQDLAGPKGRAAIAAQALANGLAHSVSVALATGIDDHFSWTSEQAPSLRSGLDALGRLIAFLKATPLPGTSGSVWSATTLLVSSEFARTPLLNTRDGRDHHLAGSCLVAGPGLRGGRVVGATTDVQMGTRAVDLATGAASDAGAPLRPSDIHATLLKSMGMTTTHLSNQSPQIVSALLA